MRAGFTLGLRWACTRALFTPTTHCTAARPSHESPARQSAGLEIDWWQGSAETNGQGLSQTPLGSQRPRAQGVSALRHFNLPLSLPDVVSHPQPVTSARSPPVVETARDTFHSHLTYLKPSLADFSFALRLNFRLSILAGPSPRFPLAVSSPPVQAVHTITSPTFHLPDPKHPSIEGRVAAQHVSQRPPRPNAPTSGTLRSA